MNASSLNEARRTPWFRGAAVVWMLVLSAGLVLTILHAFSLRIPPAPPPLTGELNVLSARLALAEQQLATLPTPLAPEALVATRRELEARLKPLEDSLATTADKQTLNALQGRVEKLEANASAVREVAPIQHTRPSSTKPPKSLPLPPFQVMGIEMRGGERFLTVAPPGKVSLALVRLLRLGESENGWTLEAIADGKATFRVNGQVRKMVMP